MGPGAFAPKKARKSGCPASVILLFVISAALYATVKLVGVAAAFAGAIFP